MIKLKTKLKSFKGRPDLTPMINVVFLLLLFFMLSSSFVQISGIKINLPQTAGENETGAEKLIISIDKNNHFFFNDEQLEWKALKEKLQSFVTKSRANTVIIVADKDTAYGEVVKLMSIARSLELNVYAATASPDKPKEQVPEDVRGE